MMHDRHCTDVRRRSARFEPGLRLRADRLGHERATDPLRAQDLEELGETHDNRVFRSNADEAATWVVVDFVDLVANLFEPNQRAYHDLEFLWSDAESVPWRRPGRRGPELRRSAFGDARRSPEPVDAAEERSED